MKLLLLTSTKDDSGVPTVTALKLLNNMPIKIVSITEYDTELSTVVNVKHFVLQETIQVVQNNSFSDFVLEKLSLVNYLHDNLNARLVYKKADLPDFVSHPNEFCVDTELLKFVPELEQINWGILYNCFKFLESEDMTLLYLYNKLTDFSDSTFVSHIKELFYFMYEMQEINKVSRISLLISQETSKIEIDRQLDMRKLSSLLSTLKSLNLTSVLSTLEEHTKQYNSGYFTTLFSGGMENKNEDKI